MSTIVGLVLLLVGLPVATVSAGLLIWWVRGRAEYVVFAAVLVLAMVATAAGALLVL